MFDLAVSAFARFNDTWSSRIAGQINDMQIKLAKSGEFVWHFHKSEDERFVVHKGRLLVKFRDRDDIIEEGEFIDVPHDVEHCPEALDDTARQCCSNRTPRLIPARQQTSER